MLRRKRRGIKPEEIKNLEDISNAIFEKKKIKFTYWKYVLDNDILKKENVNTIECSPYNIVYNLQQFYVICLKNNASKLYTYRIDRMKNITILEDKVSTKFNKNEINDYIKSNVSMFSGKTEEIEFVCNTKLLDMIVEQFGKDIVLKKIDDNSFYAKVLSYPDGFKYFALRNLENIEVIKPISLRIKINNIINDYLNNLKTNKTE